MKMRLSDLKKFFNGAVIGFVFALVFSFFSSINTIIYINKMHGDLQQLYGMDMIGQNSVQTARIDLVFLDSEMKNLMLAANQTEIKDAEQEMDRYQKDFSLQIGRAEKNYKLKKSGPLFKEVGLLSREYFRIVDAVHSLKTTGVSETTEDLTMSRTRKVLKKMDALLNSLDDIKVAKDLRIYKAIIREHEVSVNVMLALALAAIALRIIMFTRAVRRKKSPS